MYEPKVDDYVIWRRPNGDIDEGWVYFKGDPIDNEKRVKEGWNSVARYITIETHVYPKKQCQYSSGKPMRHKNIHCLLLCPEFYWNELEYVKHRRINEVQHYSQYDDVNQEEKIADQSVGMYKSQEGRIPDY